MITVQSETDQQQTCVIATMRENLKQLIKTYDFGADSLAASGSVGPMKSFQPATAAFRERIIYDVGPLQNKRFN